VLREGQKRRLQTAEMEHLKAVGDFRLAHKIRNYIRTQLKVKIVMKGWRTDKEMLHTGWMQDNRIQTSN
jgi:hypothetical protein